MKFGKFWSILVFAILVAVFVFLNNSNLSSNLKQNKVVQSSVTRETARVVRVIDGDTIEVSLNNKKETIRLIGIDAPELADSRSAIECFAKEASDKAKEISGKTIQLESDPTQGERDKYGRLLRYAFINNLNFNKLMISEGYAFEYTYQNNPYKYMQEFKSAERIAKEENKGLWNDSFCKIP